jgi:hypothetical protein
MFNPKVSPYNSHANVIRQQHPTALHPPLLYHKPIMKKVSFKPSVRVQPIREKSSTMTPEEKSKAYYSQNDMKRFQAEGGKLCKSAALQAKKLSMINPALSTKQHFSSLIESDTRLRGLEAHVCPTRTNNRSMVNKAVLAYNRQLMTSLLSRKEREAALAEVYSSLSSFSKVLAVMTAKTDMAQAYEEDSKSSTSESPVPSTGARQLNTMPNIVSPVIEKRKRVEMKVDGPRRKRRKTY